MLGRVLLLTGLMLVIVGGIALAGDTSGQMEADFVTTPMRVQTLRGFSYLYQSKELVQAQLPMTFSDLTGQVTSGMKEANIQPLGGLIAIYRDANDMAKPFTLECGFSVPSATQTVSDLKLRKLEPFHAATMIYSGSMGYIDERIQQLQEAMTRAGLKSNGEYREYYLYWEDISSPNNVTMLAFGLEEPAPQAAGPRIEEKGQFFVAGLRYEGENKAGEIPQLWEAMLERMPKLEPIRSQDRAAYGIARALPGIEPGPFEYLAAVSVKSIDDLPEGMVGWSLPAHTYAIITAKGVPDLERAIGWFYGEWLPNSSYESSDNYLFEQYTEEFETDQTIYLWFPVKKK